MWTITDGGILVNLEAVRSIGMEVSDDRQFVEVQVRWANDGDRFAIASLIVQDYGNVPNAMVAGQVIIDAIEAKMVADGMVLKLPHVEPPK